MSTPGYLTKVNKGGTSTAMLDEAMSVVSGNTYAIDDTTKEVWDRDVVPTFEDNGVPIPTGDIDNIDYLQGQVTFTGAKTGPITVSGNFIPIACIAGANTYNVNMSSSVLVNTDFCTNNGFQTKDTGLIDVVIGVERFDDLSKAFFDTLDNREPVLIDILPQGATSGSKIRGWFIQETDNHAGDVTALETESLSFQLDSDGDGPNQKTFIWV